MKRIKNILITTCLIILCGGCVSTYWEEDKTYIITEIGTTNIVESVHVGQKAFLIKSDISGLKIPYHGQTITLGNYSSAGDVAMVESFGKMITYGLIAYSSMGSVPAMEALLAALKSGEVDAVIRKYENGEEITLKDFPVATRYMPRKKSNK